MCHPPNDRTVDSGRRKPISCLSGMILGGLREGRRIRRRNNIPHVVWALSLVAGIGCER